MDDNKLDILMYIAVFVGGVVAPYIYANGYIIGVFLFIACTIYIFIRAYMLYTTAKQEEEEEEAEEAERIRDLKMQTRIERERKYNSQKDDLINKYGVPSRVVIIDECESERLNINNEFMVFGETKKIWACGREIAIDSINDFIVDDESIIQKGQIKSVSSTSTGSMVGRTITGAIIGGGAAAVIGGLTAKKQTIYTQKNDKVIHNYMLVINVQDLQNPIVMIKIGNDKNKAMEINALMQVVMSMK